MQTFKHAIHHLRHRQQLLALLVFSLVAIIIWVGVSLITSQKKTSISPEMKKMAEPLTPTLNQPAVEHVEQRDYIPTEDLQGFPIFTVINTKDSGRRTPSPTPSPTPNATESASPVP